MRRGPVDERPTQRLLQLIASWQRAGGRTITLTTLAQIVRREEWREEHPTHRGRETDMGFDFGKFLAILGAVAPVILMVTPGGAVLAPLIPVMIKGIAEAQQMPGKTGPEKKAIVLHEVEQGAHVLNTLKPGTIDPALAVEAAGHGIDAVITSIHAVETAQAALPAVPALIASPPAA